MKKARTLHPVDQVMLVIVGIIILLAIFNQPRVIRVVVKVPPPYRGMYYARYDRSVKFERSKVYVFDFSKGEPSGIPIHNTNNQYGETYRSEADDYRVEDIIASDTGKSIRDRYTVNIGASSSGERGGQRMNFEVEEKR